MIRLLDTGATISEDRVYRYRLWRIWSELDPPIAFCMLNPSTADERNDDATIRRCIGFAKRWGHGGIVDVNLFALRATDPSELTKHPDPIGPDNDTWISKEYNRCYAMIAAWGVHGSLMSRGAAVKEGKILNHLGLTKAGHPKHPLYLSNKTTPKVWK